MHYTIPLFFAVSLMMQSLSLMMHIGVNCSFIEIFRCANHHCYDMNPGGKQVPNAFLLVFIKLKGGWVNNYGNMTKRSYLTEMLVWKGYHLDFSLLPRLIQSNYCNKIRSDLYSKSFA